MGGVRGTTRMNVGLVIYGSLQTLTGGYIYDKYLVDHLESRGHKVWVINLSPGSYLHRLVQNFSRDIFERLCCSGFEVLLEDELCHPSLFLLNRRLRKRIDCPVGTIVHHLLSSEPRNAFENLALRIIEKRYLQSVNAFIFNSETTRESVMRMVEGGQPSIVAYPAGDRMGSYQSLSRLEERAFRPGPLHLLFLGSVIARKGLLPLLECLDRVPGGIWKMSVVGDLETEPPYVKRVRNFIKGKNWKESVSLWGELDQESLADILRESHVLFMPYAYEGFGIACLEGMAFGLPAVGSSSGAAREIIQHGQNGFLIPPHDSTSVENVIQRLHADRGLLYRMGIAALKTFHSRPTWRESMGRIADFLLHLSGKRP